MNKTWLVLKNEFITTVSRRSFIITLFFVPVVSAIIAIVISTLGKDTPQVVSQIFSEPAKQVVEGYVDQSGLIESLPDFIQPGSLLPYTDIEAARGDLLAGKIESYYVVSPDYLDTGKVVYVRRDFNPLSGFDQSTSFHRVLQYNLLGQNAGLTVRIAQPLELEKVSLSTGPQREQGNMLTFFLPYLVTMLFYVVILTSSSLILNSLTNEKQNRVLEILMVSIQPIQLLTGKIIALGLVGLLQTLVWSGAGMALLRLSGQALDVSAAFQLPLSILAWGALFFLLGYAVYASLMAGVGALVPNLREASQATTIMVMPMVVPLLVIGGIVSDPNGSLAVILSLFPLTAPVAMMTRLSAGSIPIWQPILSAFLLLITAVIAIRAVAGMFRAQTLLSGQAFSLKLFFSALAGRA